MLISGIVFVGWVFHYLLSFFFSGSLESLVAVGCLVESASAVWWVTESSRDGLREKAERGCRKELRGFCSHQEAGPLGS